MPSCCAVRPQWPKVASNGDHRLKLRHAIHKHRGAYDQVSASFVNTNIFVCGFFSVNIINPFIRHIVAFQKAKLILSQGAKTYGSSVCIALLICKCPARALRALTLPLYAPTTFVYNVESYYRSTPHICCLRARM